MQVARNTYLKFVDFTQLLSWSSYALLGKNLIYTQKYSFVRIGKFLKRNKEQVQIEDGVLYKRPTIRINGNGISLRDEVDGKTIGTKNQFRIYKNQFLLSKIDARNGAFGVVPEKLDYGIITGNFWTFDVDYSLINPYYLSLLTGTKEFQKLCQTASVGTTNRNYLQEDLFLNFEIPLPSLSEQETLVKNYFNKIVEAEKLSKQAEDLESEIERYFLEHLGVEKTKKQVRKNTLSFVAFENIEKWGVEYNLGVKSNYFLNSSKYKLNKLKTLIDINPSTILPKNDLEISFIPMECISDERGEVIELRNKKISESKGYTKFKEGDLIWARITPCMQNGKSAIVKNLTNGLGVGSTEFHVLRNSRNDVNIMFIHTLLRLEIVLKNAMSHFTGSAGQQRVPKSFLEELEVPLPPLTKQHEIVKHIQELKEKIIEQKTQAEQLKHQAEQEFDQAIFS